jgi:transposase-like protein
LNNVLEQDHRAIKRRVNAGQHFRSFWGVLVQTVERPDILR